MAATIRASDLKPDEAAALRSWRAASANARGKAFEAAIRRGCSFYSQRGVAQIDKTPEPFRVMRKGKDGLFTGRFCGNDRAQPDFCGTLMGGKSVYFECKSTDKDRVTRRMLTDTQMDLLEKHHRLGAICFVACEARNRFYTIPWVIWRDMQKFYHAAHIKEAELRPYEVWYRNGAVLFLGRTGEMEQIDWRLWEQ